MSPVHQRRGAPLLTSPSFWASVCALMVVAGGSLGNEHPRLLELLWSCPLVALFELPCPTCGTTRVALLLSELRPWDAAAVAPVPFLAIVGALVVGLWSIAARVLARLPSPDVELPVLIARAGAQRLVLASWLGLWGYAILGAIGGS